MSYNKKWADLKTLTPEQTQRGNFPRDFWNYHANAVTGFAITENRSDREMQRKYWEKKYHMGSGLSDSKLNGGRCTKS
jgi:hypothetical protein